MKSEKHAQAQIVNRKARHEYHIEATYEAGIVLTGNEVKSIREGRASIQAVECTVENGEVIIYGMHIAPYEQGNRFNVDPLRPRKLLLHKSEILRIARQLQEKGYTLIPLKVYFDRGFAKLQLGLARGKKLYDKREAIAQRDLERERRREEAGRF